MVGEEVSRFLLPLVFALAIAIVTLFTDSVLRIRKWSYLLATIAIGLVEGVIYSVFVIR